MDIARGLLAVRTQLVPVEGIELSNDGNKPTGGRTVITRAARVRDPIGDALRELHDTVANEPIPASFLDLVAEIEKKIEQSR